MVDLTPEEVSVRDAKALDHAENIDLWLWEREMAKTDPEMPRIIEDILDKIGIDGLPQETIDVYNNKKAKRAEKPV